MLAGIFYIEPEHGSRVDFDHHRTSQGSDYSEVNDFSQSQIDLR